MSQPLRVVFLGTPQFAVPTLEALQQAPEIELLGALTQPDRPAGRGQKLAPPPIKTVAESYGVPVFQPKSLKKDPAVLGWLRQQQPDFLVTAAFGQILSQEVLDIPKIGTVNVHASLLPEYRGPNPVQRAILDGKTTTGITTMLTDVGVDTGDILLKAETPIGPNETTGQLTERLAHVGASLLIETLLGMRQGTVQPQPQAHEQATHAGKCHKEDAQINWLEPAERIHNKIRAFHPWPGAYTFLGDERIKLLESRLPNSEEMLKTQQTGAIFDMIKDGIRVQTGQGILEILRVHPPGKREMNARDWWNGVRGKASTQCFGAPVHNSSS